MLDLMRKHAKSWGIRLALGAIIVTFAFFFGYSALRKGGFKPGRGETPLEVNGVPVDGAEFGYFLDNNLENLRENFKGTKLPDFVQDMAKKSTVQQMVTRTVMVEDALGMGMTITDDELADTIKRIQSAMQGGEFDPLFYKQRFLPRFENRYGLDYEELIRKDILLNAFRDMFATVDKGMKPAAQGNKTWSFEIVEFGEADMAKARELLSAGPGSWKSKAKGLGGVSKETGPVSPRDKDKLPALAGDVENAGLVFGLTKANPVLTTPIENGGKVYAVRLIELKEAPVAPADDTSRGDDFFKLWMSKELENAKIKDHTGVAGDVKK
jgi:hypothetical protein